RVAMGARFEALGRAPPRALATRVWARSPAASAPPPGSSAASGRHDMPIDRCCEAVEVARFAPSGRRAAGTLRSMVADPVARVLVVEDDASTAAMIVRGLRAARFEVELAIDGTSALRRVTAEPWDAAVLDLMLPG